MAISTNLTYHFNDPMIEEIKRHGLNINAIQTAENQYWIRNNIFHAVNYTLKKIGLSASKICWYSALKHEALRELKINAQKNGNKLLTVFKTFNNKMKHIETLQGKKIKGNSYEGVLLDTANKYIKQVKAYEEETYNSNSNIELQEVRKKTV